VFRSKKDEKVAWLERHSRLYGLTRAEVDTLAATADRTSVTAGTTLVHAGERGREAFLLVSGQAEVRRDGDLVAALSPGDLIGEQALVAGTHRNADVVAVTDVELAVFDARSFGRALAGSPVLRAHLDQTVALRSVA
jgi:CRP/FNR family transcriptional regulator, cyclic AMP receptor protein